MIARGGMTITTPDSYQMCQNHKAVVRGEQRAQCQDTSTREVGIKIELWTWKNPSSDSITEGTSSVTHLSFITFLCVTVAAESVRLKIRLDGTEK